MMKRGVKAREESRSVKCKGDQSKGERKKGCLQSGNDSVDLWAGRVAAGADLACVGRGARSDVLRALELVPPEKTSVASMGEIWRAGRFANEECKAYNRAGGKDSETGKNKTEGDKGTRTVSYHSSSRRSWCCAN